MLDYHVFHWANELAARHDAFEDPLKAYVQASEVIFALGLVALFLAGPRLRRAAVSAGLSAGVALMVAHFLAAAIDRHRPFVDHPLAHNFLAHASDPGFPSDHATGAFAIAFALVLRDRVVEPEGAVERGLHEPDPAARRVHLLVPEHVGGASRQTEAAVDAVVDELADHCEPPLQQPVANPGVTVAGRRPDRTPLGHAL